MKVTSSTDRRYFPSFLDSGRCVPSDAGEALLAARGREKSREAASGVGLGRKPQVWQSLQSEPRSGVRC